MDNASAYGIGQGIGSLIRYLVKRPQQNFENKFRQLQASQGGDLTDTVAAIQAMGPDSDMYKKFVKYTGLQPDPAKFPRTAAQEDERFVRSVYNGTVDMNDPLNMLRLALHQKFQGSPMTVGGSLNDTQRALELGRQIEANTAQNQSFQTANALGQTTDARAINAARAMNPMLFGSIPKDSSYYPTQQPSAPQPLSPVPFMETAGAMAQGVSGGAPGNVLRALSSLANYIQSRKQPAEADPFRPTIPVTPYQIKPAAQMLNAEAGSTMAEAKAKNADTARMKLEQVEKPVGEAKVGVMRSQITLNEAKAEAVRAGKLFNRGANVLHRLVSTGKGNSDSAKRVHELMIAADKASKTWVNAANGGMVSEADLEMLRGDFMAKNEKAMSEMEKESRQNESPPAPAAAKPAQAPAQAPKKQTGSAAPANVSPVAGGFR